MSSFAEKEIHLSSPWSEDLNSLLVKLHSSEKYGLSEKQAREILHQVGKNTFKTQKKESKLNIFFKQFHNAMSYTLLTAIFFSFLIQELHDALAITSILLLNSIIGFIQESKASDAIEALKSMSVPKAKVFREGSLQIIPAEDVVPGDILQFSMGDYVVADARIIKCHELSVNEASLTGESLPVEKGVKKCAPDTILPERMNMIFGGSAVLHGTGTAIVTATGDQTEVGHIAKYLQNVGPVNTPLQYRLRIVSLRLLIIGIIVIFIVSFMRFMEGFSAKEIFLSAIGLAIAAIPEGLPAVVTISLALSLRRMIKKNILMRDLSSAETLGSTDIICTDKTGTLTTGEMSVRQVFLLNPEDEKNAYRLMAICNHASLQTDFSGNPTEMALLKYLKDHEFNIDHARGDHEILKEWSFDSQRKRMTIAIRDNQHIEIFSKGAPEVLLNDSSLDEKNLKKMKDKIQALSERGLRVLGISYKKVSLSSDLTMDAGFLSEHHLDFMGLISLSDPPKENTLQAIKNCKKAGISVIMMTGDHPRTAVSIGRELGIIPTSCDRVLTGVEIDKMPEDTLKKLVDDTFIYARVSPSHKYKIIDYLQQKNHIVAMTGDGVNDAPALMKAEIGVAMGKRGTEVARQSANMIITDDNFSTIVTAVEEGRSIYGNIRRTIQYLLSTNLAEIMIVFGASLMKLPIPFTPLALLWINLVTDGLPSLALASEPLDSEILKNSRRPSPSSFFDRSFLVEVFGVGMLMTLICLGVYFFSINFLQKNVGSLKANTYLFYLLVYMSLLRSFSCRSERKTYFQLKFNVYHLLAVVLPILLQILLGTHLYYQKALGILNLELNEHFILLIFALFPVTIVELFKIFRKH